MLARQASLAVCRGHTWDTATSKGASLVQKDLTLGLTLTHRQTHAGRRLQSARELFAWMATKGPIEALLVVVVVLLVLAVGHGGGAPPKGGRWAEGMMVGARFEMGPGRDNIGDNIGGIRGGARPV
eukprot:426317-Pelagomonas_calceolata.AAC.1